VAGAPGGRRAVAVVALGFVAMLASSAGQSFWLALFVDDMIAGTGLSRTGFSSVYAVATVASALMVLVVGGLFDRRGPALTWAAVAVALATGALLMSVAAGALLAGIALALLRAFGQGSFPLIGTLMVAGTFDAWRGRALSIASLGLSLAGIALPPVAAVLIAEFGWRGGLRVTALAVLVLVAPLALAVRWTMPARPRVRAALRRPRPLERARRFPWRDGGGVLLVTLSATPLITTAVVFHATSLIGRGTGTAAAALSVLAVGTVVGALAGGALVDRLGVRASLLAMNALLGAGTALLLLPGVAAAFAGFVVIGLATGVNATGAGAAWAQTYGVERLGELQGVGDAARIAGAAIGPLPLAVTLALTGSYDAGLVLLVVLAVACALLGLRVDRHPPARPSADGRPAGGPRSSATSNRRSDG
jgi:MFS family permease